jgi:nucleoside-diphosphate-sugar epimerase
VGQALPQAVVVFGASGFIGRNVVDALKGQVERLVGVNASGRPVPGCERTFRIGDLGDVGALPADSAVIHVAAHRYFASRFTRQQEEILAVNQRIAERVYRFALERGISEVRAASSSAVYPASWEVLDDARALDLNDWPHAGEAAYAWSKRWGEIVAELWRRQAGVHTISLRLTNPYGPYDTCDEAEAHVATAFVLRALSEVTEFELRGDPEAERDFVFAGDVARVFVDSLRLRGVQAAINCASGRTTTVRGLAEAAMAASGWTRPLKLVSPPAAAHRGVKSRRATAARMREVIPSAPAFRSLDEGLKLTLNWYRNALRR